MSYAIQTRAVKSWRVLLGGMLSLVMSCAAFAGTYYLSPGGSDSSSGTSSAPWKSLTSSMNKLRAGDTLVLKAGTYYDSYDSGSGGRSGMAGSPITVRGETGAKIVTTGRRDAFLLYNSKYVVFENLEIKSGSRAGIILNSSSYITIRQCHIYDAGVYNVQTTKCNNITVEFCRIHGAREQHAIYFSSTDYPVARGNILYGNARAGIHCNGALEDGLDGINTAPLFEYNVIYNCGASQASAINMDGVEKAVIRNNLLYNNYAGGITSYVYSGVRAGKGHQIYHNTIYFKPGQGRYGIQLFHGSSGCIVKNNIVVCGGDALEIDSASMSGLVSNHNVWYRHGSSSPITSNGSARSLSSWRSASGQDAQSLSLVPKFSSTTNNNYHILSGCPTINAGTAISGIVMDLDSVARPQGGAYDLGCYEYAGATPTTAAPTTTTQAPATTTTRPATTTTLPATSGEVVIDNKDTNTASGKYFRTMSGTWTTNNGGTARWPLSTQSTADYRWAYTTTGAPTAWAEFVCTTLPAGQYEVFAWWGSFPYSMGTNVPFDIHHAGGMATRRLSQAANGGKWNSLGVYSFPAGQITVRVCNGHSAPGRYIVADAIRIVPVGGSVTTTTQAPTTTSTVRPTTTTTTLPPTTTGTYYLSPSGSDSNAGTSASPWKTLTYAINKLKPGNTLILKAGTYNDSYDSGWYGRSGIAGSPITIRGETGAKIVTTGRRDAFLFWNSKYVVFENLEIKSGTRAGIIFNTCSYMTIRNCHIYDAQVYNVQTTKCDHITVEFCRIHGAIEQHAIYFSSTDYPIARNNILYSNGRTGIHCNGALEDGLDGINTGPIFENNIIYNNGSVGGSAINMDGVDEAIVRNNLIYNNKAGGITSFSYSGLRGGRNGKILNNTIYFPAGSGRYGIQLISSSTGWAIKNNVVICGGEALEVEANSLTGLKSDSNLWVRHGSTSPFTIDGSGLSLASWRSRTGGDANSLSTLPSFVSTSSADFHLQAGSPGVNGGATIPEVPRDLTGTTRPQGGAYDMGCYER